MYPPILSRFANVLPKEYSLTKYLRSPESRVLLELSAVSQFEANCDPNFVSITRTAEALIDVVTHPPGFLRLDAGFCRWLLDALDYYGAPDFPKKSKSYLVESTLARYFGKWYGGSASLCWRKLTRKNPLCCNASSKMGSCSRSCSPMPPNVNTQPTFVCCAISVLSKEPCCYKHQEHPTSAPCLAVDRGTNSPTRCISFRRFNMVEKFLRNSLRNKLLQSSMSNRR